MSSIEKREYPAAAECWRRPKEMGTMGVTKAADTREELAHTYDATWECKRIDL